MCDQSRTDDFFPVCDCTEFLFNLSLKIPHPGRAVHTPVSQDLLSALSPLLSALVLREPKRELSLCSSHWLCRLLCAVFHTAFIYVTLYIIYLALKIFFFFFGVDHFYSLYWISYNIASVCYVCIFWPQGTWDLSFLTRDWTLSPCIGRWSLNHWTAREVPIYLTFNLLVTLTQFVF